MSLYYLLINSISGLIVLFIGYLIWKKQYYHSKKLEVYIKAITTLSLAYECLKMMMSEIRQTDIKDIFNSNKDVFLNIQPIKYEFRIYFGSNYDKQFDLFTQTIKKLLIYEHHFKNPDNVNNPDRLKYHDYIYGKDASIRNDLKISLNIIEHLYNPKKKQFKNA